MKKWGIIVAGAVAGLVAIVLIGFSIYLQIIKTAEPEYSGRITLPNLQEEVFVQYDEYAVPHVEAQNQHDLYYTAGYLAASERMWQMEMTRLAGQGRLAEFLGPELLDFDKYLRTIGFHEMALRLKDHISEESMAVYSAYTAGINAYIDTHKDNLPLEYRLLGFEPEPWKVEHSLVYVRLMAWELNIAWHLDIVLGDVVDRVGETKGQDIIPRYDSNKPVIIPEQEGRFADGLTPFLQLDREFREFRGIDGTHIGSNSWVVSGERSESGKPILANDPHLSFTQPSKWYEMHLRAPGINVAGVTLAGLPGVVIGHNDSIAWGFTSVMADDADFFIEEVDQDNPYLYMYEGQWTGMDQRREVIEVKGAPAESLTARITRHGPVVSDIHPMTKKSDRVVAMRWTGHELSDELAGILAINKASDWDEFSEGVGEFHVPGQNMIYADINGNIGFRPAVKIPLRRTGTGNLPVPGNVNDYEWIGFRTPLQLPYLYNPDEGFIATANNKTIDDGRYRYHISNLYEPPSRIQRIRELLNSKEVHSADDFKQYQMDYLSPHAREVTPYFIQAFRGVEVDEVYLAQSLDWFRTWDYRMDTESIPATLFNVSFMKLVENTYKDELGDTLYHQFIRLANAPIRNLSWLLERPNNLWWDNIDTPALETRDAILRSAVADAVQWLRDNFGRSMVKWQWGHLHQVTFPHSIGEASGFADALFGLNIGPFEIGGSGTTVNNGEYNFQEPYTNILGPSMRHITDMADIDGALSVIYSGQSGHPFNPHYADQVEMWRTGEYHRIPLSREAVAEQAVDSLYLVPEE
ncbi:MAG: penicillin acylase family protein [Candidatus Marinimicrobia bacterium]|nr:penicillin acylase family protein [Candidatus Neomarinimicrobiota bacterium]MCF7829031.1 penicillin acylase family protein [Candidatus Neomarinimicrobiota bacterium]MCF7881832.1 penicillin acylase family protein [Candidatus Neomarinimicrobiota bacterium]